LSLLALASKTVSRVVPAPTFAFDVTIKQQFQAEALFASKRKSDKFFS